MKTYEVTYSITLESHNTAVVSIDAESEEAAMQQAHERMISAEWDDIYEDDSSLEHV